MPDNKEVVAITYHDLKDLINNVLDERDSLDRETHKMHHKAMQVWLEKQERHDALIEHAMNSVVGVLVLSVFGALAWIGKIVLGNLHIGVGQ